MRGDIGKTDMRQMVENKEPVVINFAFFQAEDGIRDVEGSRGLGDVYEGQAL